MKKEAVAGAAWTVIDRIGGQALSFVSFAILAHLLLPAEYGLVGLALAIVAVPTVLLNEGFATILIQRQELEDEHINAAFWANLALSLVLVAALAAGAGWVEEVSRTPSLAPILRLTALTMVPAGMNAVAWALFIRRLQYSTFALRTLIAQTTCSVVAIAMAVLGFGVWALVAQQLTYAAASLVVLWIGVRWRPRLAFSRRAFGDILHFSARTMMGSALRYAHENVAALIIGFFLSPTVLGYYYLTQRLLTAVYSVSILPVGGVMMPVLSRMQNERQRLGFAYLRLLWAGACLWIPAVALLGATAPHLIVRLFGAPWQEAVALIMVMCAGAAGSCLTLPTREILWSTNRAGVYAGLNAVQLALTILSLLAGVRYGVIGCGAAYVAVSLGVVPFHLQAVKRCAGVAPREIVARLLPVFAAGAVMAAAVYGAGALLGRGAGSLAAQLALGALVYPAMLYLLAPGQTRNVLGAVYEALPVRFQRFGAGLSPSGRGWRRSP